MDTQYVKTSIKNQGLDDNMLKSFYTVLNISEPFRYATLLRSVFNGLSNDFLTHYRPRPFSSGSAERENISTNLTIAQMSPNKFFAIAGRLRRTAKKFKRRVFWFFFDGQKRTGLSGLEDKRNLIITIASNELGVSETTGKNDGTRVEEYLKYTGLSKGNEWCAAFVSWCYGQAGMDVPRNPWSPALFLQSRQINEQQVQPADLFGVYGQQKKRIVHVGLVKERGDTYILSIEGNSNDKVESRRRHKRTIYRYSNWLNTY